MLHSSFENTKSFFSENGLQYIAQDICFPSFTTLHVEHFFVWLWQPQTKLYYWICTKGISLFLFNENRTPDSLLGTCSERTVNKREPEWLYNRAELREEHVRPEDSVCVVRRTEDALREEVRDLGLFAKEFGQGVQQQRVRDKTREKARTLPLAQEWSEEFGNENAVDMLEEL